MSLPAEVLIPLVNDASMEVMGGVVGQDGSASVEARLAEGDASEVEEEVDLDGATIRYDGIKIN